MIVLGVTWVANAGHVEEVAAIFRKLQAASRQELGCLMYVVHLHKADPARFFIYEQYKDESALLAHRDSAHFQYAVGKLKDIAVRKEGELYSPLDEG